MTKKLDKAPKADTLLVELLTEELPPKALRQLSETFRDALAAGLEGQGLLPRPYAAEPRGFATPRRLAVSIKGVLEKATDVHTEKAGPLVKAGAEAAKGFARKCRVSVESLEKTPTPDGDKWLARYTTRGAVLDDVLAQKVEESLKALPIPKLMRWGNSEVQFARPIHGLVMMHGKRVVPGNVRGVSAGATTHGHRFVGSASIRLADASEYEIRLRKNGHVIADFSTRKSEINEQLEVEAKGQKARLGHYQDLLEEVTALVEFPAIYTGAFDPSFLEVPQECLILTMRQNQKYFPLFDASAKLLPKFLIVSNMSVKNASDIIGGNERVVRPRFEDARFFFNQDRKTRLEARVPQLAKVVYHNKLGSQLERMQRIKLLSGEIARMVGANVMQSERAAELSKADLLTGMVGEFPELQGVMGRYYALHDGEPGEVAGAIEAHYLPRFAGDRLPQGKIECSVALADKLEALAGFFGIGQQPSGDKDPFGLRRHALGIVRILIEGRLSMSLNELVSKAFTVFPSGKVGDAHTDLETFIYERLRGYLREGGFTANEVESVLCKRPTRLDQIPHQLAAVRAFAGLPEAESLAAANKRVANILKQAEAKGESFANVGIEELKEPAERRLFDALRTASQQALPMLQQGDFAGYLKTFAILKVPVDAFFDSIMVMVEDRELRKSRLALLSDLREQMNKVADISKLAA
jgi:glycyl-tRNA synthetase beta chain